MSENFRYGRRTPLFCKYEIDISTIVGSEVRGCISISGISSNLAISRYKYIDIENGDRAIAYNVPCDSVLK
jgi:hypothetical protein